MRIKNALVYTVEHGFEERDVRIKNGCFAGSEAAGTDGEEILDAGGDYLIPGLVDIHFHGCAGHDFSDGTPEALQAIGAYELRQGVTSICPASMTRRRRLRRCVPMRMRIQRDRRQSRIPGRD